ncbi:MAG TPA: YqeG family HAD IIIA-type phosphatase [Acholeplasmataceae bacterium]|jgi:HAD superfamily phosphatase (TIGR01668 family)|nr:YqeG family HAD IIIA-type phosphatase [Acholeplasmataceae bacterium]
MIHYLFKIESFIPYACRKTVYDIDYNKLYEQGKRILLMDLDNTLLPYDKEYPDSELKSLFRRIKDIGFTVIIMSNNVEARVKTFAEAVECDYVYSALKPLKRGYQKALKKLVHYDHREIICIGDQLLTDVLGSSRLGLKCILVKPIMKKSEKWYTKFNRTMESQILKRLKKKYPNVYKQIIALEE